MKLLFTHDHIFYKYNDKFYSTGGLSKEMLERYSSVFEEVIVLSRQKEIHEYNNKLTLASTERVRFVEVPNFKSINGILNFYKGKKIINEEVKNCDRLIARLPSWIGSLSVYYAKRNKKKYMVEVVACAWDEFWNHSIFGKIMAPCNYFTTKKNIKNASYVLYVTNYFLQKRYPTLGMNVSCSNVALSEFNSDTIKNRLTKIKNRKDNEKIIIGTTAAVNVRFKGQQYIIKALAKMKEKGITNYEYQLVGGGDPNYLRSLAEKYNVSEQVKFLGTLPHNKVFEWLDNIDIYAQPSRQEGLPRALIEAMSKGVPSLGARTAGIPELLDEKCIFNNSKNNIEEICNILLSFNKDMMKEQAKRNYKESMKYDKNIIEERRRSFIEKFKFYK